MEVVEGNKVNLRYPVNAIPPVTAGEWIQRDIALLNIIINPFALFRQYFLPYMEICFGSVIFRTADENGNNWDNNSLFT